MFAPQLYDRYLDDHYDRQHYGAKLKLKKFDTEEFVSLPPPTAKKSFSDSSPNSSSSSSLSTDHLPNCVEVRNVSFHYTSHNPILKDISISVPQGKIYALLGSSGCGKTTLLRIILGRLKALSGDVSVFDCKPGTAEANIPGPGVGYMPQDLALFTSFTIKEVLTYYGRLYGLDSDFISSSVDQFVSFLNLPPKHRLVSKLSGGQQRRVSLAVTLIHSPPLLILDEPTVGVDSMLRLRIWNYLEELCEKRGTTVIITTHYTEEAKNAYRVGFIDSGLVLAEDSPEQLLKQFKCKSLEDVFLELCLAKSAPPIGEKPVFTVGEEVVVSSDGDPNNNNNNKLTPVPYSTKNVKRIKPTANTGRAKISEATFTTNNEEKSVEAFKQEKPNFDSGKRTMRPASCGGGGGRLFSRKRLNALLTKNYILFKRNPVSIILLNILPVIQIGLYCFSFARDPHHIPVAIVNHDNHSLSLSHNFLSKINPELFQLQQYENIDSAIDSIHKVKTWLAIEFPANFSRNFRQRFTKREKLSQKMIDGSKILTYPDNSHAVFSIYSTYTLLNAFKDFVMDVGAKLGDNPRSFGAPIQTMKPIYGVDDKLQYSNAMTPGMILCVVHGMSMLIGSFTIVRERNEGHLERGFVSGIRSAEIIMSHILFLLLPVISQVILVLFTVYFVFDCQQYGSFIDILIMATIQGVQGMIMGVAASILCPTEVASLLTVFILEMPLIFTSGILWPIECLPVMVQNLILWNPLTLPTIALRSVTLRGWSFEHFSVLLALLNQITYTLLAIIASFGIFQLQNSNFRIPFLHRFLLL